MRILATGGAGYVGSAVLRVLLARGHRCFAYDNLSKGHRPAVPGGYLIEGEIADRDRLAKVIQEYKIEAVMHRAFAGDRVGAPAVARGHITLLDRQP